VFDQMAGRTQMYVLECSQELAPYRRRRVTSEIRAPLATAVADLVSEGLVVSALRRTRLSAGAALVMCGIALAGCTTTDSNDPADQAQKAIVTLVQARFPDRTWGAACSNGADQSVTCSVVFSATTDEPLATMQAQTDAAIELIERGQLSLPESGFPGEFTSTPGVGPAELSAGGLVPIDLHCSIPTTNAERPYLGLADPDGTFLARTARYDCHAVSGNRAGGVYPEGGGFTVPG
jgi:hypothetical protein